MKALDQAAPVMPAAGQLAPEINLPDDTGTVRSLAERRGYWRAVVAIAAKNARLAWAVLKYGEDFRLTASTA